MFNRNEIWRFGWPKENRDILSLQDITCRTNGMWSCIVMLKYGYVIKNTCGCMHDFVNKPSKFLVYEPKRPCLHRISLHIWLFYHQPNLQPFGCSLLNQTVRQHCCGHTLWVWDHWSLFRWCCNVKTIPQTGLHALIPKSRNPLWTVLCISEIADAVDDAIIKHGRRWRSGICWRHA